MRFALIALVIAIVGTPAAAWGDEGTGAKVDSGGQPKVWVSTPGADPPGSAGGSGTVTCGLYSGGTDTGVWLGTGDPVTAPVEGEHYWIVCSDGYVNFITYTLADLIDGATLARRAFNELPLLYPRPRTAPPATAKQLVGVRTWLWVDADDWRPMSATASIPGLSATVTAQPSTVTWEMGDGTTVTCNGPGTPYDPNTPDDAQSTDCGHTYQHDGDRTVLTTIEWTVSWTASNGEGGTLPAVQRSTQFPLTVEQRQAVITG